MQTNRLSYLSRAYQLLFVLIGSTVVLYYGRSLLIPLAYALVLALLLLPLCQRLEKWGLNRALAAVIGILLLAGFFTAIFYLLSWQLRDILQDSGQLKEKINALVAQVQAGIASRFGLPKAKQQKLLEGSNAGMLSSLTGMVNGLLGTLVDIILVLVYIFLLLEFRDHLRSALLKAVPESQRENVKKLVGEAGGVAAHYLLGLLLMIACLWVMYGIGFSVVGVKYAIFFALLCGILELIPFFGNITGTTITVCMGLLQGGDFGLIAGILVTYGSVQFLQSYILQPLVVGREVNLNPLFTILCIVIGDAVWRISGMVLAVPLFGMLKITCDHFEPLKPYGFLLGGTEKRNRKENLIQKLRRWVHK
jgi:predicted PurR-regulated permease PerM